MIKSREDLRFYLSEDKKVMGGGNFPRMVITWLLGAEHSRMMLYIWVLRHLEFYNTHPYMTAPILGVASSFYRVYFEIIF